MAEDTQTTRADVLEASPDASDPAGPTEESLARGRASGMPFVLLGGVAFVIWSVVALVAAVVLLIWWLG
jgi:hypothetical protein